MLKEGEVLTLIEIGREIMGKKNSRRILDRNCRNEFMGGKLWEGN